MIPARFHADRRCLSAHFLLLALAALISPCCWAQQGQTRKEDGDNPLEDQMTLSDAGMYLSNVVHNYVAENSKDGLWIVKEDGKVWRLRLQDVLEDTTIQLSNRVFSACAVFSTERKPLHRVEIEFTVDFSKDPWTVKNFTIHKIDDRKIHPRLKPKDTDEDESASDGPSDSSAPNGPEGAASSAR